MLLVEGGRLLDGGNFFYIYHPFLWKYNMNTSGEKSMALFFFAYTMKECFRIFTFFFMDCYICEICFSLLADDISTFFSFFNLVSFMHGNEQETGSV